MGYLCTEEKGKTSYIAEFDHIDHANTALRSLMDALNDDLNIGWDAIEEKKKIEASDPRSEKFAGSEV